MKLKYLVILSLVLTPNIFTCENLTESTIAVVTPVFDIHSSLEHHPDFPNLNLASRTTNHIPFKIKWSILIPTIVERAPVFEKLYAELTRQITILNLTNQIEILYFRDQRGENLVGFKRNLLLEKSLGEYTCFVDDDDLVHKNYIQMIYEKLRTNPDCVSLTGIITTNGRNPRRFVHYIKYNRWFTGPDKIYYRPPNHLNPIKRTIACQFKFPLQNNGEDSDWSMQICKSQLIKTESEILKPYYFYRFNNADSVQNNRN
ncbi:MAG TPA: glycosyltransferase family A protein [Candidatus Babeliales bacterium]|nr:glycosyltransferase family A protein [Candidatus Babeliales bacterium]